MMILTQLARLPTHKCRRAMPKKYQSIVASLYFVAHSPWAVRT
jgi:hypothetical protein